MDDEEESQEVTSYEMTVTDSEELRLKIAVGDRELICHMRVNQAFSFLILFVAALGRLSSAAFAEGDLGIFSRKRPPEGEDPTGSSTPLH